MDRNWHDAAGVSVQGVDVANVDTAQMRLAGRELLSLALIDARNNTLRWAAALAGAPVEPESMLRQLGHIGWFQEYWIARNVQRQRGERCDVTHPKLASIMPEADVLFEPVNMRRARAKRAARSITSATDSATRPLPDLQTVRQYLVDSLETTLELLSGTPDEDETLYFYRLALLREDSCIEHFATLSQTMGFDTGLLPPLPARGLRPPLLFASTRWLLGCKPGGFVYDREKWAHEVPLPEFEIDSQAVTWAQYCEFVEDGGYDDRRQWTPAGWAWVQEQGRRTPRYVDQMRQGVLQQRFGKLMRVPLAHPVVHVSWFEADAWCRWAGRRLPSEAEWEAASMQGASRGFRWGDVLEWTSGTLRPYPGFLAPSPGQHRDPAAPAEGAPRVLRGASFATRGRLRFEKARHAAGPERDDPFTGFRSCAI
jgi:iron(II)-dependent oxidoreductase